MFPASEQRLTLSSYCAWNLDYDFDRGSKSATLAIHRLATPERATLTTYLAWHVASHSDTCAPFPPKATE
jgi:hypothetical protein